MVRKDAIAVLAFMVAAGVLFGAPGAEKGGDDSGTLRVSLTTSPDPLKMGMAELVVEVRDSRGRLLDGAVVRLRIDMLGHSMGELSGTAAALGHGRYGARVNLSMAGPWQVDVDVESRGESTRRSFKLSVL